MLDRIVDRLLAVDLRKDEVLEPIANPPQLAEIIPRAVGALDLPVTKQIADGKYLRGEQFEAADVIFAPVVAVGELEAIDVPLRGRKVAGDDLLRGVIGARNPRAAALAIQAEIARSITYKSMA